MLAITFARPIPAASPQPLSEPERESPRAGAHAGYHVDLGKYAGELKHRAAPVAQDGLPLWDATTFSEAGKADDAALRARNRRGSLRPQHELLASYVRVGDTTVEDALREYGSALWRIRQKQARPEGLVRKSRLDAVAALGGPKSARGVEYTRRCRLIVRFNKNLARLQESMLGQFPAGHSHIVRQEIEKLRWHAMHWLANGQHLDDLSGEIVKKIIQCSVERAELQGYDWPLRWLWSKLFC